MLIDINKIETDTRIREEMGDIEDLANSLKTYGMMHPIVVTPVGQEFRLIVGERRYIAARHLKWKQIPVTIFNDLDSLRRKAMEIEENIKRKSLTWEEVCRGTQELEELMQALHGKPTGRRTSMELLMGTKKRGFGRRDTAKLLDKSVGAVTMDIQLAEAIEMFPELADEKNATMALKKFKQKKEELILRILAEHEAEEDDLYGRAWLQNEDVLGPEGLPLDEDKSIDLFIVDPPWGIELQDSFRSRTSGRTGEDFDDSRASAMQFMGELIPHLYRTLKDNTHMYFFFGMTLYDWVYKQLTAVGFEVDSNPIVWSKGRITTKPTGNRWCGSYETIFFCRKGNRKLRNMGMANVINVPTMLPSKKIHPTEKPIEVLIPLILNSTVPNEFVVDPCAGSFSTHRACIKTGRRCISFEKNFTAFQKGAKSVHKFLERMKEDAKRKDSGV